MLSNGNSDCSKTGKKMSNPFTYVKIHIYNYYMGKKLRSNYDRVKNLKIVTGLGFIRILIPVTIKTGIECNLFNKCLLVH